MRKFIFLNLIFFSLGFSLELSQIEPVMREDLKKAVLVMQNNAISEADKPKKMFELFDGYFDYDLMAKLALSKQYKTLDKEQQIQFKKVFEKKLKQSFTDKLAYYTDQVIEIQSTSMPNKNRFFVNSLIVNEADKYNIVFKFHRADGDNFLIYDVDILGVSIIQTYRSQFEDLSQNVSFDDILKRLEVTSLLDNNETKAK
ncbi:ABC transporter substrate-binding protein [Campylobacter fetus]|uniref:Tgt2/MlaC family protein n=1 Tax=Campylobacter fetus TaxID=196 RepID=UPI0003C292BA|nr:ABC transporter substrate-binding protein [Campylobacter fetus]AGZ81261.1 lipid asymmetry ABC transporter MlaABCDEF, periplasmic component MlaC [Campylobacter fetus subsp. testudinum 03-427]AJB45014.1 toluene tolerance protein [Campylobacter fetus subsp. testudinum]ALV64358.1 lipid asymmetry ABC transporter MlaABCDEF, periplasmic component MlaC [Campylobacter fetus subsp. testudinum Sp3]AVK80681.1 toluene tolerance protein [Campylobacter fetus subsp. testudinum]EAI4321660.1 ABC transporter 